MTRKRNGRLASVVLVAAALATALAAGEKPSAYAVIIGTVFRESGHAFAGVEVALTAIPPTPGPAKKAKAQKLVASGRGEVVFRVPPGPMRYTLTVKAKGYKPLSKTVDIQAEERQDVSFLLELSAGEK